MRLLTPPPGRSDVRDSHLSKNGTPIKPTDLERGEAVRLCVSQSINSSENKPRWNLEALSPKQRRMEAGAKTDPGSALQNAFTETFYFKK